MFFNVIPGISPRYFHSYLTLTFPKGLMLSKQVSAADAGQRANAAGAGKQASAADAGKQASAAGAGK